jgi:outer membrane protein assembly factor BamB
MKINILRSSLFFLGCVLLLTACDKDKIPLTGTRESFIALDQSLQPDSSIVHEPVNVDSSASNRDWPQVGGNTAHAVPPVQLSEKLQKVWQVNMGYGSYDGQRLISGVVVYDGTVYGMDAIGDVYAIDATTGQIRWKKKTTPEEESGDPLGGGVAFDNGTLYATTSFGEILSLNPKDGAILWRANVMSPIRSAPTVKDGRVFVVTINNETHAFDAKAGTPIWVHAGIVEQAALLGTANPAVIDNVVIVAYSSGEICALQAENGHELWVELLTSAVRIDTVTSIPHIRARPVIDRDQVIAISHGGRMTSIDLKTGIRQWQKEVGGIRTPAVSGDWIFLLIGQGDVLCLQRSTGKVRWAAALPKLTQEDKKPIFWAGPVIAGTELVFSGTNGQVQFLSIADGKMTKTLTFEGETFLSPVIADKTLYILNDQAELYAWK